ncbi:taste receptor type 2 member 40-like [Tiliqua scincoides]|uniref:taste receptor type 2 member 40-like n=1 Tax=Tiliqua scincoides TaxID=71010 RepID=UPI0034617F3F
MNSKGCDIPRDNLSQQDICYLFFTALENVVGVSLNAFIVVMNCIKGIRERRLKSVDKIMTALGISKICYLCILEVKIIWTEVYLWAFEATHLYQGFKATIWFLTCTNLWFSACLCAFYCAKISNFQNHIFICLKARISRMVPWLLLVSVLVSLTNTTPFYSSIYNINCKNNYSSDDLGNHTSESMTLETNLFNLFLYCGTGFSLAFFILTMSTFLLLFSLWRHTDRMQNSSANFSNPSMDAHFKAVKTIFSLLIIDSINFTALMLLLSNVFPESSSESQLCTLIVNLCPSVQSNILIWSNPRLKRAFIGVLHYIRQPFMF